jgi:hypothetical protein
MVAALSKRFTTSGTYDSSSNPTITQVETWIDQVSGMANILLAEKGFAVPVVQADCVLALQSVVVGAVNDLCQAANSAGRFFTDRALESGIDPMKVISNQMADWIGDHAEGFEAIGAARSVATVGGIGYRDGDDDGNSVSPLFGRNAFGADPRYGR